MSKFYRVLQDTFMWNKGAIIEYDEDSGTAGGYVAIDDIWDAVPLKGEYISARIIESADNSTFFERVYPLSGLKKKVFGTKKQAQPAAAAPYEGDK